MPQRRKVIWSETHRESRNPASNRATSDLGTNFGLPPQLSPSGAWREPRFADRYWGSVTPGQIIFVVATNRSGMVSSFPEHDSLRSLLKVSFSEALGIFSRALSPFRKGRAALRADHKPVSQRTSTGTSLDRRSIQPRERRGENASYSLRATCFASRLPHPRICERTCLSNTMFKRD